MDSQTQQKGAPLPRRLTEAGERSVAEAAAKHGVSVDATSALLQAIIEGNGHQAQFNHPDLGGMGQWLTGGMLMIGDMFNNSLKAKISALADDLARAAIQEPLLIEPARPPSLSTNSSTSSRWPEDLGTPSTTGSQNQMHYAFFPASRRLAIVTDGHMTIYDTQTHVISGLAQQQGSGQSLTLTSQHGPVPLSSLQRVHHIDPQRSPPEPVSKESDVVREEPGSEVSTAVPAQDRPSRARIEDDHAAIFAKIEGLSDLYEKKIITAEEYAVRKAELLDRL